MPTTLKALRRAMLARMPGEAIGRLETIASIPTAKTLVVTALATGGRSADDFRDRYMLRAEATTAADRVRRITDYTASTGTLTHTGADYSDQTATSEFLEILTHEPRWYDDAIQLTLSRLLHEDRSIFPTVAGQTRYWLSDLPWIVDPGDIERVAVGMSPVISRDRYLEKWGTVNSSGALQLDFWTLSGSGATLARSTAGNRRTQYTAAITRAGTNALLSQTTGLLLNGTLVTNGEDLRGKTVTLVGVGTASSANQLRFQVTDGTQTVSTSYHTGDGTVQELSAQITVAATATTLTLRASVEVDGTPTVDELYIAEGGAVQDAWRRDEYAERDIQYEPIDESFGSPVLQLSERLDRGQQLVLYSRRPYPQFDATRVASGSADADVSDAPVATTATMAIGRLFEGLARNQGENTGRYASIAADWNARGQRLAEMHLSQRTHPRGGANLPKAQFGLVPNSGWR